MGNTERYVQQMQYRGQMRIIGREQDLLANQTGTVCEGYQG